ncbi:MAG: ester cyclase [Kiloniellaceae bacterium]
MSTEQARAIVERFFDEAWAKNNISAWDELPEDLVFWNFGTKIEGRDRWIQAFVRPLSQGFPDLHIEPEFTVAENDKVVVRWHGTGTHTGEFRGVAPTGKAINIAGVAIYRVADDRIVEGWSHVDTLTLLTQIGAIPS